MLLGTAADAGVLNLVGTAADAGVLNWCGEGKGYCEGLDVQVAGSGARLMVMQELLWVVRTAVGRAGSSLGGMGRGGIRPDCSALARRRIS
jgi:hypothetical protein